MKPGDKVKHSAEFVGAFPTCEREAGTILSANGSYMFRTWYDTVEVEWPNGDVSHTNRKWLVPA